MASTIASFSASVSLTSFASISLTSRSDKACSIVMTSLVGPDSCIPRTEQNSATLSSRWIPGYCCFSNLKIIVISELDRLLGAIEQDDDVTKQSDHDEDRTYDHDNVYH